MGARFQAINRKDVGRHVRYVYPLPNLVEIQLTSYERFLQREAVEKGLPLKNMGLEAAFRETFPISNANGDVTLEYAGYTLEDLGPGFSESECKKKGMTYAIRLKARINLCFAQSGEIRQKDIYMGDIPLMTDRGTFIINGAERVVVSQIYRSPGVIFAKDKNQFTSRIIPHRGSWLEFELDSKKEILSVRIDRKKRILATLFLRALGLETADEIIEYFYETKTLKLDKLSDINATLNNAVLAKAVYTTNNGETKKLFRAGTRLHVSEIDELIHENIKEITIIDTTKAKNREEGYNYLESNIILNCLDKETSKMSREASLASEPTRQDALREVYAVMSPGDPITIEAAEHDIHDMFSNPKRYDLGPVGRYKLNKKFGYEIEETVLTREDIITTMLYLIKVYHEDAKIDDIDHLANRRIRSVGELLTNVMKVALQKMEKTCKERMNQKEVETYRPQDLISIKPIVTSIKEFFGSSQLSQFMDQVNPLAELTHKRRINALGPGGLSRDRAGFEVRDVHYSHYGRMCPIETPEGPNIGLIVSLAAYSRVNEYGFLETPYRKVVNGTVTNEVEYLSAIDEEKFYIAQANTDLDDQGRFRDNLVSVRRAGDFSAREPRYVQYMDVAPMQVVSVSAALIPFLEHDDANRALMGSNMQRQAVPLLFPEPPIVGTGMEAKAAYDSGALIKAKRSGVVEYVSAEFIKIRPDDEPKKLDIYELSKFLRTNQDTCFHQRPTVMRGARVQKGEVIADGPATYNGELALGRNLLLGFVPWNGYNYEDAILISERVVREDVFTSIHIKEFTVEVRETKLGPEKISRDIPNVAEKALEDLDEEGIVRIGARVKSGSILVGKLTPKSETETNPEFKLLMAIFGEKAKDVKDTSLRLPHGVEGVVIDVQRLKRSQGDDLSPGVEEQIKVLVAKKRKLREGDKMAGRHGNKGVVAKILPVEDMPFLEDGTPLDICLNPLGVPSRMNIGQLLEAQLGLAGYMLKEHYTCPVFQSTTPEDIEKMLESANLPKTCKMKVFDGRTGRPFENPVMVGVMYVMKLHHLVDDKMHARSTGPYSLVTQQPLGGKAQFGGQRLGEMEVWALEAYGAANTLQELLTIKSDDMNGRSKIYEDIVKGNAGNAVGIPESFNVLVQELRGLALDLSIYNAKGQQIALTEKDEELISKKGSQF